VAPPLVVVVEELSANPGVLVSGIPHLIRVALNDAGDFCLSND
jgi:hypothetical protein